jgi:hypothetical protein
VCAREHFNSSTASFLLAALFVHGLHGTQPSIYQRKVTNITLGRLQVNKLKKDNFKPQEQVTLEPYERDHAVVIGAYRVAKKSKKD